MEASEKNNTERAQSSYNRKTACEPSMPWKLANIPPDAAGILKM
jgi:hypothetical protein